MKRARAIAYWTLPSLVCLAVYWAGLRAWFQQDDFFWLYLDTSVRDLPTLLKALFEPLAQGSVRPLSERAFFMVMHQAFGLWATPFRAVVFATEFANLILLGLLVRRVTGSRAAGFLAPLLWGVSASLATVMSWTSAYNQALCAFFLLAALYCFVRYAQEGDRRFLVAQWFAFVLGFGALELNAIYPALAAVYALCCARKALKQVWPMFGVSALYTMVHFWAAAPGAGGTVYAMHFDGSLLATLGTYSKWALGAGRLAEIGGNAPGWAVRGASLALAVGLAWFLYAKLRRREWAALLPVAWFGIALLPVLPLRDHVSGYYLFVPAAGLAWLLAWGVAEAGKRSLAAGALALAVAGAYAVPNALAGRMETRSNVLRSYGVRTLVWGAVRVRELHPGKAILFHGLDWELFWAGVASQPFRVAGVTDVAVTPETGEKIPPRPEWGRVSDYVMPPPVLLSALDKGQAVVYTRDGGWLRAVTQSYWLEARRRWRSEEPRRVDVGHPSFAGLIGPSWYNPYQGQRWMPRRATVRLGGPRAPGEKLYVTGYCPLRQVAPGPLGVTIGIEGADRKTAELTRGDAEFTIEMPLSPELVGKKWVVAYVEVERTSTAPPDRRELGLAFGTFEIR